MGVANVPAASFDYVDSSVETLAFNPGHVVLDTSGAWVVGNATARFRADGSLAFANAMDLPGGDALLAETSDGGLIEAPIGIANTPFPMPCALRKLGPSGALQWSVDIPSGGSCAAIYSDAQGVIWVLAGAVVGYDLYRIEADGSGLAQIGLPANFAAIAAEAPLVATAHGIYLAGVTSTTDPNASGSILKLDESGAVVWQWIDSSSGTNLNQVALDAAGNVYASGYASNEASSNSTLVACSVTSAGIQRWCQHYDLPGAHSNSGFEVAADGSSFVYIGFVQDALPVLAKIGANGDLAWGHELAVPANTTVFGQIDGRYGLRLAPNGDVLALSSYPAGDIDTQTMTTKLLRFDNSGNAVATSVLTGRPGASLVGVSSMTLLPDSSALLTTYSNFIGVGNSGASSGLYLHLDRSGQPLPSPFVAVTLTGNSVVLDSVILPDGTAYLLTQQLLTQFSQPQDSIFGALHAQYALSRISPSGARIWKNYFDGYWYVGHLSQAADKICIGGDLSSYYLPVYFTDTPPPGGAPDIRVECYATNAGAKLWSSVLQAPDASYADPIALRVLDSGNTVVAYADASAHIQITTLDAAGHTAQKHALAESFIPASIGADGSNLFVDSDNPPTLHLVRTDGTTIYTRPLSTLQIVSAAELLDDNTASFFGVAPQGVVLVGLVSPSGALQWTAPVGDANSAGLVQVSTTANQGDIFVAVSKDRTTLLTRLNRSSGLKIWQTTTDQAGDNVGIVVDPVSGNPVLYNMHTHKIGVQIIDRSNGTIGTPAYRTCGNADCAGQYLQQAQIGSDGTLREVFTATNFPSVFPSSAPQIVGIAAGAQNPLLIPAAQSGISGAWFAPYTSGQGFVIDYVAAGNVFFMPWFTYTQTGGNDPQALAWYTFQGSAAPGAAMIDLAIGDTQNGVFQSGTVGTRQVGTASARFSDCDHGSISYQFDSDVNGGAGGVMDIVRLGPSTSACDLGNGAMAPAENSNLANDGFDSNQSGSWFNPETSGQGIEFTIIPAGNGFAGLLYAAWFTFEPGNGFSTTANQHWFTLQGDLSTAANGKVIVPIVATLGGTLDGNPTGNSFRIGEATVTFNGCTSAKVDYQFDNSPIAHAYAGLSGSMSLVKIGGCAR